MSPRLKRAGMRHDYFMDPAQGAPCRKDTHDLVLRRRDVRACTFASRPLQALIVLPRRQAILFRRRIPSERDMGRLQQIDVDMVKQSAAALVRSKTQPHPLILSYDCHRSRRAPRWVSQLIVSLCE